MPATPATLHSGKGGNFKMNAWFEKDWADLAQVFRIQRTITEKGEQRKEVFYGITSISRKHAPAKRLLELNRKHWFAEIVSSQMTKTYGLAFGGGWDHVTDLNLLGLRNANPSTSLTTSSEIFRGFPRSARLCLTSPSNPYSRYCLIHRRNVFTGICSSRANSA
jgi:hypothetical protein